jgi:Phosphodiester glycosidase
VIVGACSTESAISPNDSNSQISNLRANAVISTDPRIPPSGWTVNETDKYVRCFKKTVTRNGSSVADYVLMANLKKGATVAPLYDTPTPSQASTTTPSPLFKTKDILSWWNSVTGVFAVSNLSFFRYDKNTILNGKADLPFVLKHNGIIRASGYEITTNTNQRWLSLNGTYATIGDGPLSSTSSNFYTAANGYYSNSTVIGGLHPLNADKGKNSYAGRTMIGIKDCDGDGLKEAVYVLITTSATQQQAYDVLRNEFGCDQTVMFDGSGSSQMKCKNDEKIRSTDFLSSPPYVRRSFAVAFTIKASTTAE